MRPVPRQSGGGSGTTSRRTLCVLPHHRDGEGVPTTWLFHQFLTFGSMVPWRQSEHHHSRQHPDLRLSWGWGGGLGRDSARGLERHRCREGSATHQASHLITDHITEKQHAYSQNVTKPSRLWQNHSSSCSSCPGSLWPTSDIPEAEERTKQEGSFLFAAKLLDKVLEVGREREQPAERQDLHQWKDTSSDAQKTQSYLPAALHWVQ